VVLGDNMEATRVVLQKVDFLTSSHQKAFLADF
jgi:hypothetical protein